MRNLVSLLCGVCFLAVACSGGSGTAVLIDVSGLVDTAGGNSCSGDLCDGFQGSESDLGNADMTSDSGLDAGPDTGPDLVCEPGAGMCEGNALSTCQEDGSGWNVAEPCAFTETCEEGECTTWSSEDCEPLFTCMEALVCKDEPTIECVSGCFSDAPVGVGNWASELFWCVVSSCDSWVPWSDCFEAMVVGECSVLFSTCTGNCLPDCDGKDCGDDGCNSQCGECLEGFECDPNGHCLCLPDCDGKDCGPNGCGAQCGVCAGRKPVCNDQGLCEIEDPGPCGNGDCEPDLAEDCFNCPLDCGDCPPCGDDICDDGEECEFCPADCGPCAYGDCCAYHDFPGCEDKNVVDCVCALEPDCCLFPWSNDCVELAGDCGAPCQ
jgi:hypothetical protein